jgi:anti-anti-sigma factor
VAHDWKKVTESLAVVTPAGDLAGGGRETVNALRDLCKTLEDEGVRDMVLNLGAVSVCPSIVLGNLIVLAKRLREKNGHVALVEMRPHVAKSVRITGVERSVLVYEKAEDALRDLNGGEKE